MRRLVAVTIAAVTAASLTACGYDESPPNPAAAQASASSPAPATSGTPADSHRHQAASSSPKPKSRSKPPRSGCQAQSTLPRQKDVSEAEARAFFAKIGPDATAAMKKYHVPASVSMAQAAHESNFGYSELATQAFNIFGMKGKLKPGTIGNYPLSTAEYVSNRHCWIRKVEPFRRYRNWTESVWDHAEWLATSGYYDEAMAHNDNADAFAFAIANQYATDPVYTEKLKTMLRKYDLYRYDHQ